MNLRELYEANDYPAAVDGRRVVLRHGQPCPALDAVLAARGLESAAYVTAFHPRGVPAPLERNLEAQARLRARVAHLSFVEAPGGWPPGTADPNGEREPSLLVLGLAEAEAVALGRAFEQAAIVVHVRGAASRLVML